MLPAERARAERAETHLSGASSMRETLELVEAITRLQRACVRQPRPPQHRARDDAARPNRPTSDTLPP